MVYNIAPTDLAHEELQSHLRQQAALAALAQRALDAEDCASLANDAARLVADGLNVEYCTLFELSSDLSTMVASARIRRTHPLTSTVALDSALSAQAFYTLQTNGPVIVGDLRRETRFAVPWGVADLGPISGASIVVRSRDHVFGVLCVHTSATRTFGDHDIRFLETMASIIAQALARRRSEESLHKARQELDLQTAARLTELERANAQLRREIAEHERARAALQASEARFWAVFELAAIGIGLIDQHGRIAGANPALEKITGYTAAELRGASGAWFYAPGASLHCRTPVDRPRLDKTKAPCHVKRRCTRKDGSEAYLDITVFFVDPADGQPGFAVAMVEDITRRKDTEEQMRKLSRALEQSADFVLITDREGVIEYVNPAFEQKTGYRSEELVGHKPNVIKSGVHDPEFYSRLWDTIASGGVYRNILANRTRNGELYYEEKTITPLRNDRGEITHFISTGRDITDRKRAEEELRRHQAELARVMRLSTMGEMAAGLAHELNQPISAIVNYSQGCIRRIRSRKTDAEELLPVIDQVRAQAQRAGDIIHRVRNFIGKGDSHRGEADINRLVREVVELAEPDMRRHDTEIQLVLCASVPPVIADPIQIQQVLLNLILNGLEAMQTTPPERRRLVIRTEAAEAAVARIAVQDTGPGLPADAAERVFEPFFTTKPKGMGMGLSICRSIIAAHNGTLAAFSDSSSGTTFEFTLPTSRAANAGNNASPCHDAPTSG